MTMNLQDPNYDPNGFIDWLIADVYKVKNDAALAHKIGISPVVISKIRHRKLVVGASMLIDIHEDTGMRVRDIKARMYRSGVDIDAAHAKQAA
jgi:hypothetical protein